MTRTIIFGSIRRFRRLMRGRGTAAQLLNLQHTIERRIVEAAAARGVRLMGTVEVTRRANRRRLMREARRRAAAQRIRRAALRSLSEGAGSA